MLPHFSKSDLEAMQLVENQRFAQANYYLQLPEPGAHLSTGLLLFLEMVFENDASLILSFDETRREIFATNAEKLIEKAAELQKKRAARSSTPSTRSFRRSGRRPFRANWRASA